MYTGVPPDPETNNREKKTYVLHHILIGVESLEARAGVGRDETKKKVKEKRISLVLITTYTKK